MWFKAIHINYSKIRLYFSTLNGDIAKSNAWIQKSTPLMKTNADFNFEYDKKWRIKITIKKSFHRSYNSTTSRPEWPKWVLSVELFNYSK